MYVYLDSEPGLWTVGFYAPDGKWQPESDFGDKDEAARRVAWLNGSANAPDLLAACKKARDTLSDLRGRIEMRAIPLAWEALEAALAKAKP